MTRKVTLPGTAYRENKPCCEENRGEKMLYTINDQQLLQVWFVIRCFQDIRAIHDPEAQAEILTKAQILLTTFVLDLQPLAGEQIGSSTPSTSRGQMLKFVA